MTFLLFSLLLLGAGCTSALPFLSDSRVTELDATTLNPVAGSTFTINQTILGIDIPTSDTNGKKTVTVTEYVRGENAEFFWEMPIKRETADSKTTRENAIKNVGVGETANIPDPVYEDVVAKGTIKTDALGNAERILLPTYWPEEDYDVSKQQDSVIWLSKQQYDELVATRSSHIELGLFDSTLQSVLNFTDDAKSALAALQGKIATDATTKEDFTKLTADGDWGSYTLTVDGTEVKVKTVEAQNAFAHYTILANADNPLILAVSLRPWALGPSLLTSIKQLTTLVGYKISSYSNCSTQCESTATVSSM